MKKHKKWNKRSGHRNAGPPRSRASSSSGGGGSDKSTTKVQALSPLVTTATTLGGAGVAGMAGAFMAREGWKPMWVAAGLGGLGAWLGARAKTPLVRAGGNGAMAAAGSQIALMLLERSAAPAKPAPSASSPASASNTPAPAKPRQADASSLPPGALEAALARAHAQLSLADGDDSDDTEVVDDYASCEGPTYIVPAAAAPVVVEPGAAGVAMPAA